MSSVGVIPFHDVGVSATQVMLDSRSEVRFWADFDGLYDYRSSARYDIDLLQDNRVVASTVCDPIVVHESVRICTIGGWFDGVYKSHCRMRCRVTVPKSGLTVVRAMFSTPGPIRPSRIDSANLTIEQ
jgi:hypothetical protein